MSSRIFLIQLMKSVEKLLFLVTCTINGFACGTLYLYSAYGPQLAIRLKYSGSDSSLMAFAGTIGIALTGVPASIIIDKKGFAVTVLLGSLSIGLGYLGLKGQYDHINPNLPLSMIYVFLAGSGSTSINSCLIKCCAISFPNNRGVATSFPIASYGLSAFVFSTLSSIFFKNNISGFLGLLGWTCLLVTLISLPVFYYADKISQNGHTVRPMASGTGTPRNSSIELTTMRNRSLGEELIIKKFQENEDKSILKSSTFWILFWIVGVLVALGQMYIYSVGFMIKSLVHLDGELMIQKEQQFEVSLLSIFNCSGRLFCGILGDLISIRFNKSRTWILFVPIVSLTIVQIMGVFLKDEKYLYILSSLNGFGYGFTWASIPQIIIELFSVNSLSFGWGFINLAPILPVYFFTHYFGSNYDLNLTEVDNELVCLKKSECYNKTFKISSIVAIFTLFLVIWINVRPYLAKQKYVPV